MTKQVNLPSNPAETDFQKAVAELLDWILIPPAFCCAFPAGWGKLGKATAGILQAAGLKRGMPDILVFDRNRRVVGIELKVKPNTATAKQREMHAKLKACNINCYVCYTQEEVLVALHREGVAYRRVNLWQTKNENGQQLALPMERSDAVP
jgi:hypothetical protein